MSTSMSMSMSMYMSIAYLTHIVVARLRLRLRLQFYNLQLDIIVEPIYIIIRTYIRICIYVTTIGGTIRFSVRRESGRRGAAAGICARFVSEHSIRE